MRLSLQGPRLLQSPPPFLKRGLFGEVEMQAKAAVKLEAIPFVSSLPLWP
jgi:hypothetical protein